MKKTLRRRMMTSFIVMNLTGIFLTAVISFYEIYQISIHNMKSETIKLSQEIKNDIDLTGMDDIASLQSYAEGVKPLNKNIEFVKIYDENGGTLVSSYRSDIGKTIGSKNIKRSVKSNGFVGFIGQNDHGSRVYEALIPIKDGLTKTDVIAIGVSMKEMYDNIEHAMMRIFIIAVFILLLSILISNFLSRNISKPLSQFISSFEALSGGDLTVRFTTNEMEEFQQLKRAGDVTVQSISEIIRELKKDMVDMDQIGKHMVFASENYHNASNMIYKDISTVSSEIVEQGMNINLIETVLDDFGNHLDRIYQKVETIAGNSEDIELSAKNGVQSINLQVHSLRTMKTSFDEVIEKIQRLSSDVGKISEITNVINTVAGQTNLLALNAAIEAARVGEQGAGFAVVADEIRKLANQVQASAHNIDQVIGSFKQETDEATQATIAATAELRTKMQEFEQNSHSFNGILAKVTQIVPELKAAETTLEASLDQKDRLRDRIASITETAGNMTESAQEIIANIEGQSELASNLQNLSAELENVSGIIGKHIKKFII